MSETTPRRPAKPVSASRTTQAHIVMPMHVNAANRLFGGRLMEWIDVVAGVTARRHAQREVLTAAVEQLSFLGPANLGDTVQLIGWVTYTGNTSMEVCVETYVEALGGETAPTLVNRAFLTMVALDGSNRPTQVPCLLLQTEEERAAFEAGRRRRAERKGQEG